MILGNFYRFLFYNEENHVFINVNICKKLNVFFCSFFAVFRLILRRARSMRYFVTIVYNVTSGNAIKLLGTAIASDSFLVSEQVLRCQRDD